MKTLSNSRKVSHDWLMVAANVDAVANPRFRLVKSRQILELFHCRIWFYDL
ncbi:MAG: hypothetical protein VB913_13410 [Rhodospirillales bacterium]|jgi:hypothetical protein